MRRSMGLLLCAMLALSLCACSYEPAEAPAPAEDDAAEAFTPTPAAREDYSIFVGVVEEDRIVSEVDSVLKVEGDLYVNHEDGAIVVLQPEQSSAPQTDLKTLNAARIPEAPRFSSPLFGWMTLFCVCYPVIAIIGKIKAKLWRREKPTDAEEVAAKESLKNIYKEAEKSIDF